MSRQPYLGRDLRKVFAGFLLMLHQGLYAQAFEGAPHSQTVIDALNAIHFSEYARAESLLNRDIAKGNRDAETLLGAMILNGLGHPANVAQAMGLFDDACQHGDSQGCVIGARVYDEGVLVPRDIDLAVQWYQRGGARWRLDKLKPDPRLKVQPLYFDLGRTPDIAPPTCQAHREFDDYVRAVYRHLDAHIDVPPVSRHWGGTMFLMRLAPDGKVTDVTLDGMYGGKWPSSTGLEATVDALTLGWLSHLWSYSTQQTSAYADRIAAGIKAASPFPPSPSWLPASSLRLHYPYPDVAVLHQEQDKPCPPYMVVDLR
ncbi:MAG: hypothetical protein QM749_18910 [Aquabacterium sp.]